MKLVEFDVSLAYKFTNLRLDHNDFLDILGAKQTLKAKMTSSPSCG